MAKVSKRISGEWETPRWLFDALNDIFQFDCDLFASDENHLCPNYFTIENSAFSNPWYDSNYGNPPYGIANPKRGYPEGLPDFTGLMSERAKEAEYVVGLLPASTDTNWFRDNCFTADYLCFTKRLAYLYMGEELDQARFSSVVVVWGKIGQSAIDKLKRIGPVVKSI